MTQSLIVLSNANITILTSVEFQKDMQTFDLIVDARTAQEYANGHTENAILVSELGLQNNQVTEQQQAAAIARLSGCRLCRVVVYRSSGSKAQSAAAQLESIGNFEQVFNGLGITEWSMTGFPLVKTPPSASASRCLGMTQTFCYSSLSDITPSDTSENEVEEVPEKKIVPPTADKDALKLYPEVNTQGNVRRQKRVRG